MWIRWRWRWCREEQQPLCLSNTAASHRGGHLDVLWCVPLIVGSIRVDSIPVGNWKSKMDASVVISIVSYHPHVSAHYTIVCAWKHKKTCEGRRCTKLFLSLFNDTTSDQVVNRWCNSELSLILNCKLKRTFSFTFGELSQWSFLFCFRELWCYLTCTGII